MDDWGGCVVRRNSKCKSPYQAQYPDLTGFRKVERLLKPSSFTLANPIAPSLDPANKKTRINVNTLSNEHTPPSVCQQNHGRDCGTFSSHCGGQRGAYNA